MPRPNYRCIQSDENISFCISEHICFVVIQIREKEMETHSSVLAWRIPGPGKPGGLPCMGSHRVGHD